jgi:DNA-binding NarL/FixJ family response regulator
MTTACRAHGSIVEDPSPDAYVAVVDLPAGLARGSLAALRAASSDLGVVGLMIVSHPDDLVRAASLSVRAFVGADQSLADLVAAVVAAVSGRVVCPPAVAAQLLDAVAAASATAQPGDALTAREREIGALLRQGLSNKEIAATLVIEPTTVKNHVHSILRKLGARRRGQVAAMLRGDAGSSPPATAEDRALESS